MSDAAHANAVAKRESLAAEINNLQQQADELRREHKRVSDWLAAWEEFAGGSSDEEGVTELSTAPARKGRSANPPKEEIAEFARELANDRGAPVSRKAIRAFIETEKGIHLEGADPDMVLSTMLWRMKHRIVRLKGFGYWPSDQVYAPADYDPSVPEPTLEESLIRMEDAIDKVSVGVSQDDSQ